MTQSTITVTLTKNEVTNLIELLHWTNDPQFRGLIAQIELASADEVDNPSADRTPTTKTNRKD